MPEIEQKVATAYLLADPQKGPLTVTQDGKKWSIGLPETAPDAIDSVLVIELATD